MIKRLEDKRGTGVFGWKAHKYLVKCEEMKSQIQDRAEAIEAVVCEDAEEYSPKQNRLHENVKLAMSTKKN